MWSWWSTGGNIPYSWPPRVRFPQPSTCKARSLIPHLHYTGSVRYSMVWFRMAQYSTADVTVYMACIQRRDQTVNGVPVHLQASNCIRLHAVVAPDSAMSTVSCPSKSLLDSLGSPCVLRGLSALGAPEKPRNEHARQNVPNHDITTSRSGPWYHGTVQCGAY